MAKQHFLIVVGLFSGWYGLNISESLFSIFYGIWETEEEGCIQSSQRFYF